MKRTVVVTIDVDPTEYHEAEDTPTGALDLVEMMLRGDTDLPSNITIKCVGASRIIDPNRDPA